MAKKMSITIKTNSGITEHAGPTDIQNVWPSEEKNRRIALTHLLILTEMVIGDGDTIHVTVKD